ncbi:uncharacterized protein LAJ45_03697 [Morchella importuna]|uniref:uncharacterized protein n=1 Tax=Morchella importuna TaxID=1174673 RepID=UPI001E8EB88C|nr:uncharacterized protein LAJ45_03697 [Morchella importuna]KAH8152271.1 hypothetical protein LAJ45_03697 [Morchella importuna]
MTPLPPRHPPNLSAPYNPPPDHATWRAAVITDLHAANTIMKYAAQLVNISDDRDWSEPEFEQAAALEEAAGELEERLARHQSVFARVQMGATRRELWAKDLPKLEAGRRDVADVLTDLGNALKAAEGEEGENRERPKYLPPPFIEDTVLRVGNLGSRRRR